jgi:hypothetical protein
MAPDLIANQPSFVGSLTSGVDGSSEGGRLSTTRMPYTLVLYGVPLIQAIKASGYRGKLTMEPALVDGMWVLKVLYEGAPPPVVPKRWHGHCVVLEEIKPANA